MRKPAYWVVLGLLVATILSGCTCPDWCKKACSKMKKICPTAEKAEKPAKK